jgi:1-phosphofructokinase family hexose kinase
MILTLLPNPALDKTAVVPNFEAGRIFRPEEVLIAAGGKGLNFARALRTLGHETQVVAPVGGPSGQHFLELAKAEGWACDCQPVQANLRTCLTIVDPAANHRLTELYEKGAPLEPGEWEQLMERLTAYFAAARFLVVCGSFPPGVPDNSLYRLVQQANAAGLPVLLDTSGPQLKSVLELGPFLVKINQHEAAQVVERELNSLAEIEQAARELQKSGARQVVISLGRQGAFGLTANGQSFGWAAPPVKAISAVGSGDSLLAGIVVRLSEGAELPEAVKWGVAAGAANTLQIGAGRFERRHVEELFPMVAALNL